MFLLTEHYSYLHTSVFQPHLGRIRALGVAHRAQVPAHVSRPHRLDPERRVAFPQLGHEHRRAVTVIRALQVQLIPLVIEAVDDAGILHPLPCDNQRRKVSGGVRGELTVQEDRLTSDRDHATRGFAHCKACRDTV